MYHGFQKKYLNIYCFTVLFYQMTGVTDPKLLKSSIMYTIYLKSFIKLFKCKCPNGDLRFFF